MILDELCHQESSNFGVWENCEDAKRVKYKQCELVHLGNTSKAHEIREQAEMALQGGS